MGIHLTEPTFLHMVKTVIVKNPSIFFIVKPPSSLNPHAGIY